MDDFKLTGYFNAAQLKELIREAVSKRSGIPVDDVSFEIGTVTQGYGPGEHDVTVLQGARVTFSTTKVAEIMQGREGPMA